MKITLRRLWAAGAVLVLLAGLSTNCKTESAPAYEKIFLSRFPVSLDFLFKTGDPTTRNLRLNQIRTGNPEMTALFLVPYPFYNHNSHFPATFKWYLYTGGHTQVSIPLAGYLEVRDDEGQPTKNIGSMTCVVDMTATLHLSTYIRIVLGHVCIDQNLVRQYHAAGEIDVYGVSRQALAVPADKILGYTHESYALDFIVEDDSVTNFSPIAQQSFLQHLANPFFYFTDAAQGQIRSYYQAQLDAMRQSGLYPESRLDRTFDINTEGTFFGTWFYKEGYFQLNSSHHPYGWYSFDGCILNILDVNKADRDSFYLDNNTGHNFGSGMIGVFCDAFYPVTVPNYEVIGGKYMFRVEGDNREGIVQLDNFFSNVRPGPIYMKYQLDEQRTYSIWDDLLYVDYFPTVSAARGSFSTKKLTYIRMYERVD